MMKKNKTRLGKTGRVVLLGVSKSPTFPELMDDVTG